MSELLAVAFATDLGDEFGFEVAGPAVSLDGPPGDGLRYAVVARLAGIELVRFKVDISTADVIVESLEACVSDPVVGRLGLQPSRFPVHPAPQHVAEKLHALTLPRTAENTRARDLVDLARFM